MNEICVDPPSGWLYGFPKVWDKEKNPDLLAWLLEQGYPQKEIDRLGDNFYCRFWEKESAKE